MEDNHEAIALDMPNGKSSSIKYNQKFIYPSPETKPKHPCNHQAMKAPSLEQAVKGIYRK